MRKIRILGVCLPNDQDHGPDSTVFFRAGFVGINIVDIRSGESTCWAVECNRCYRE